MNHNPEHKKAAEDKGRQVGAQVGERIGGAVGQAHDKAQGVADQAKDKAQAAATQAQDKAQGVAGTVQGYVDQARDAVGNFAETARDRAGDFAGTARERAEGALHGAGEQLGHAANRLKDAVPAAAPVADRLRMGGDYLKGASFDSIGGDLTRMVRNYPLQALLLGVGVGFFIGSATKRS